MNRVLALPLPFVFALAGCGIENELGEGLPKWPESFPPQPQDLTHTDSIMQVQTPQVDILWMVDNSCSMANEQSDLTANFPAFMDYFLGSGLDYHVGVVNSDLDRNYNGASGSLRTIAGLKYIDPDTPSPIEVYAQMATMGTTGSGTEQGLGATFLALEQKRDTANAGFYRDDAALHTIIISDEPDLTRAATIGVDEYKDWYDGLKPDYDMRSFSAIIDFNLGGDYRSVAQEIGGLIWDITSDDWPVLLDRLGVQAAGLKKEYFLSHVPAPGTIVVEIKNANGALLPPFAEATVDPVTGEPEDLDGDGIADGDWVYDEVRNSVTFLSYIPESLSTVLISYTVLASQAGQTDEI
jgi:hypothetical protein